MWFEIKIWATFTFVKNLGKFSAPGQAKLGLNNQMGVRHNVGGHSCWSKSLTDWRL